MSQKVSHWFNNQTQKKGTRVPLRLRRMYNGRRVYGMEHQKEVREVMVEMLGVDKHDLVTWNRALKKLWEELDADSRAVYNEMAKEWNLNGPEDHLKPTYVGYGMVINIELTGNL